MANYINLSKQIVCCLACGRDTRAMTGICAKCGGTPGWGKGHLGKNPFKNESHLNEMKDRNNCATKIKE